MKHLSKTRSVNWRNFDNANAQENKGSDGSEVTLSFPNPIRRFDKIRNAVHFIGYDGLFEVSFFIEAGALSKSVRGEISQTECLTAFDAACDLIHDAARKVYSRKGGTSYMLTTTDF